MWHCHLSRFKKKIRFNLLVVLYGGYHVCIVTLSPVYQLMDNILNGSMFKNVHDRVIP